MSRGSPPVRLPVGGGGAILEDGDGIDMVQKLDTSTGAWTEVAPMLIPRSGSAAAVLNNSVYVIGEIISVVSLL